MSSINIIASYVYNYVVSDVNKFIHSYMYIRSTFTNNTYVILHCQYSYIIKLNYTYMLILFYHKSDYTLTDHNIAMDKPVGKFNLYVLFISNTCTIFNKVIINS